MDVSVDDGRVHPRIRTDGDRKCFHCDVNCGAKIDGEIDAIEGVHNRD